MRKVFPITSLYFKPQKKRKCDYCKREYLITPLHYIANCCEKCWEGILDE